MARSSLNDVDVLKSELVPFLVLTGLKHHVRAIKQMRFHQRNVTADV